MPSMTATHLHPVFFNIFNLNEADAFGNLVELFSHLLA